MPDQEFYDFEARENLRKKEEQLKYRNKKLTNAICEEIIKSYDLVELIEIKSGLKVKSFKIDYEGLDNEYKEEDEE
jgi:hypothetical protein